MIMLPSRDKLLVTDTPLVLLLAVLVHKAIILPFKLIEISKTFCAPRTIHISKAVSFEMKPTGESLSMVRSSPRIGEGPGLETQECSTFSQLALNLCQNF